MMRSWVGGAARCLPGVLLCAGVSAVATALEAAELHAFGRAWLEALVLAILVGTAIRTVWAPSALWKHGIGFSAKFLLEVAVVLLGASVSAATVLASGLGLLAGIAATVAVAIVASYAVGRVLGLPRRMATLVACGNSICGNSAIAAVAPVIGADGDDVAASIAFTAVLGVAVVIGLPLLMPLLHLTQLRYGVMAGLTVYAVPQVLAATAPVGALAVQIGTLVKLVRVLMLGPVVLALSFIARGWRDEPTQALAAGDRPVVSAPAKTGLGKLVPWFIIGFLLLMAVRSLGWLPSALLPPLAVTANLLTVISMAALGLGTDLRAVARAGLPVTLTVVFSLLLLGAVSYGLILSLHLG